jgi:hypothetical protein
MNDTVRFKGFVGIGLHGVGQATCYSGLLCATVALIFQLTAWLRDGRWTPLPLSETLSWGALQIAPPAASFMMWINHPSSWFGLHKLVGVMPTVAAFALLAFAGMLIADCGLVMRRDASECVNWGTRRTRSIWQY